MLQIHILDIGQGDSIYLQLPHQYDILIDAGPDDRVLSALGKYMPFNDKDIELLILTHNHLDHIGGVLTLLDHYNVRQVWVSGATDTTSTYRSVMQTFKAQHIPMVHVAAGGLILNPDFQLVVLHPPPGFDGTDPDDQHDATIVTKFTYKNFCILLTGDLNFNQEQDTIAAAASLHQDIHCPALKVTHHGSKNGSSDAFLDAVQPVIGVISVGAKNLYHHPSTATLERLVAHHITTYRTDRQGTITISTDGYHFWTKTEK